MDDGWGVMSRWMEESTKDGWMDECVSQMT